MPQGWICDNPPSERYPISTRGDIGGFDPEPVTARSVTASSVTASAVIVSRALGIPCVVSVTDATRRIADGATVTVDGTNGTVTIA
ncbi:MAG: hypothetical protein IPM45_05455 [Acidimicrobiales bacterium]|nr:hypothetical protein [Acidimicrobiales bacterium]